VVEGSAAGAAQRVQQEVRTALAEADQLLDMQPGAPGSRTAATLQQRLVDAAQQLEDALAEAGLAPLERQPASTPAPATESPAAADLPTSSAAQAAVPATTLAGPAAAAGAAASTPAGAAAATPAAVAAAATPAAVAAAATPAAGAAATGTSAADVAGPSTADAVARRDEDSRRQVAVFAAVPEPLLRTLPCLLAEEVRVAATPTAVLWHLAPTGCCELPGGQEHTDHCSTPCHARKHHPPAVWLTARPLFVHLGPCSPARRQPLTGALSC
jgi:hypothetical protein